MEPSESGRYQRWDLSNCGMGRLGGGGEARGEAPCSKLKRKSKFKSNLVALLLTTSVHAQEGYSNYFFCVSVCHKLILKIASFWASKQGGQLFKGFK